jgi:hypothetical protein
MRVCDATQDHEDEHDGEGGVDLTGRSVAGDLHERLKMLHDVKSAGVERSGCQFKGLGCRVWGFGVEGLGFRVQGLGFRDWLLGTRK